LIVDGGDPNGHEARIQSLEGSRKDLWDKIGKLDRFQAWATGLAVGGAGALGLFADYIKKHLGL
jgi:hypothetical protein